MIMSTSDTRPPATQHSTNASTQDGSCVRTANSAWTHKSHRTAAGICRKQRVWSRRGIARTCDDLDAVLVLLDEAAHRQPEAVLRPILQGAKHQGVSKYSTGRSCHGRWRPVQVPACAGCRDGPSSAVTAAHAGDCIAKTCSAKRMPS